MDWKKLAGLGLGGTTTVFGGGFILPYANQFLSFIPAWKLLIEGVTPHAVVAYGAAFYLGSMVKDLVEKKL